MNHIGNILDWTQ